MLMYNTDVCDAADQVKREAIAATLNNRSRQGATVILGPAGAGKSTLIVHFVGAARQEEVRIVIGCPTNEQVFDSIEALATELPNESITALLAKDKVLPVTTGMLPNVAVADAQTANQATILVGTLSKLGDAHARGNLEPFDLLLVDEACQADSGQYFGVAGLALRHLLVGDPGQLCPFTPLLNFDRYRGLDSDPLQTAVGVLLRNHPATPIFRLPITRRLPPEAVPVVRSFYPEHNVNAAVLPGVRQLSLENASRTANVAEYHLIDAVLEQGKNRGFVHLELPDIPVIQTDSEAIAVIGQLTQRLLERQPTVRCERYPDGRPLTTTDIAVVVSHNNQKALLRRQLQQLGLTEIVVDTANKLQGRTFEVVVAWHPLSGELEADQFHVEAGRLCVMLTRHRQACFVIGRAGDRKLVEGLPPSAPAYLGDDSEPLLTGWQVHRSVFKQLAPYRIAA